MQFVQHPQHTRSLGAPHGWDHTKVHCGSLSIKDGDMGGYPAMLSRWEPTLTEALCLALGAEQIELSVLGRGHPPVAMGTMPKVGWTADRRAMERAYNAAFLALRDHAKANGIGFSAPHEDAYFLDQQPGAGG